MAVVENIRIEGDTSGFQQQIDALNKKIEELEKNLAGAQKETADIGKEAKKTGGIISKAFNGLKSIVTKPFDLAKKAASGLGTLLKGGLGFGLVTAALDKFSESFNANQKVVDAFNKVLATLGIIFNQITEAIFGAVEEQSKLNGGFDATKKVLGGLISGVLNVFVGIIQGIKLAVQEVQLAWEQSFFGDKDATRIKELNKEIAQTREELKETGNNLLESGKMVVNNLAEAAGEVANTVVAVATRVAKTVQKIDLAKAAAQAERLVELQKQAALADVARQKIQLEFQNTQEQLRQLRDDEQNSLAERQKANDQLLASFEKQAELEKAQLNIKVAAAAAEYEITKTNENLVALKQAQLELTDLDERLQGQRSEALANQN
jgi:cell division septum initiation protein DivIVA